MRLLLPVQPQKQLNQFWCWAAVTSMVSIYYALLNPNLPAFSECQAAGAALGGLPCCGPATPVPCARLFDVRIALNAVRHFQGTAAPGSYLLPRASVAARRPIAATIQYIGGPMHVMLAIGFDDAAQTLDIVDPASGTVMNVTHASLLSNPVSTLTGWVLTD